MTSRDRTRHQYRRYSTLLPSSIALVSQEEMVARIEAIRLVESSSTCPTCSSTVSAWRTCNVCLTSQPLTAFSVNSGKRYGRRYICRACDAARNRRRRADLKRLIVRDILRRATIRRSRAGARERGRETA